MFAKIVQVVPTENFMVFVHFEDGKVVLYDVKPLLGKNVFSQLNDINFFMDRCTILNDTLAWDCAGNRDATKCIDIAPDTLYDLQPVKESII